MAYKVLVGTEGWREKGRARLSLYKSIRKTAEDRNS